MEILQNWQISGGILCPFTAGRSDTPGLRRRERLQIFSSGTGSDDSVHPILPEAGFPAGNHTEHAGQYGGSKRYKIKGYEKRKPGKRFPFSRECRSGGSERRF